MVNIEESQEWQRIAAMDLSTAEYLLGMSPLPIEIICYHCQQSAEKYLSKCHIYYPVHNISLPRLYASSNLTGLFFISPALSALAWTVPTSLAFT